MSKAGFLEALLKKMLSHEYTEGAIGDLWEIYSARAAGGRWRARVWLGLQISASLFVLFKTKLYGSVAMFKNYFRMAFRNLNKHRGYTSINIFGLALGLSAVILILLYLQFEFTFDRFHAHADHIYRVGIRHLQEGNIEGDSHVFTPPIGPDLRNEMPEVEDFVRMSTLRPAYLEVDGKAYKENRLCYASPGLFRVFSFPLKSGDSRRALEDPYSLVLSERAAGRIFGTRDPLGESVQIGPEGLYRITGVVENPPANSTIQFDVLVSFATLYTVPGMHMGWNGGNQYITYIKLQTNASPAALESKFPDFMGKHINEMIAQYGWKNEAYLQPLKDIHFHYDAGSRTSLANFYTFAAIAAFILLIACINFVNLTTARAARRAKEVGLRKVIGAHRGNLIRQFLGESVVLTFLAFLLGIGLAYVLTPTYNQLLDKQLDPIELLNPLSAAGLLGLILAVGVASGIHPAVYLSAFQPVKTLKGRITSGRGTKKFRNALVVFQFAISVALIICTLLIRDQRRYMKQVELGYDKDNMLVLPLSDRQLRDKTEGIRPELLSVPGVMQVAASSDVPHAGFTSNGYIPEGYSQSIMIHALDIDLHFLETYDIEVVQGRNFSRDFATDKEAYLINQTLAKQLGWDDPLGKTIARNGEWKVIGVVKDFQFATLHDRIEPLLITSNPWGNRFRYLSIKINTPDIPQTLAAIETVNKKFSPVIPFEYFFLDDAFDRLYKNEERFEKIFRYFSFLAILIALLGLFSLSAYSAQQKAKEIGIRKVLGATIPSILGMFSKEMLILIFAANVAAAPVAFYVINRWLEYYAYRMTIGAEAFVLAFMGSLIAAFTTISYQSLKAAFKKPVEELRAE
jgi:putative ABC transport system permease protein